MRQWSLTEIDLCREEIREAQADMEHAEVRLRRAEAQLKILLDKGGKVVEIIARMEGVKDA